MAVTRVTALGICDEEEFSDQMGKEYEAATSL
jgi:hypothetical protein